MAERIVPPTAPALPVAPRQYDPRTFDTGFGVLRIFAQRVVAALQALLGPAGGSLLSTPSITAPLRGTLVTLTSGINEIPLSAPIASGDVLVRNGRFVAPAAGLYRLQFSMRLFNAAAATRDATVQLGAGNPVYVAVPGLGTTTAAGESLVALAAGDTVGLRLHQSTSDLALSDYSTPFGDSLAGAATMTFVSARP